MHCFATPAHCLLIASTATFPRWETAVVLCMPVGEGGTPTQAGVLLQCASVPAHVVVLRVMVTLLLLLPGHLAEGDQLEEEKQ